MTKHSESDTMSNVKIHSDSVVFELRPGDSEYDGQRPDTREEHYIYGLKEVEDDAYFDLSPVFELQKGVEYYLLCVVYETGDSFGCDEGRIEYVDLFKDSWQAHENARKIQVDFEENQEDFLVTLTREGGKEYKVHTPWKGSFERLQYVKVESVQLLT